MNLIKQLSDRINEEYSSTTTFYALDPVGHAKFYLSALEWVSFQIEALNDEHNNGWISVDDRLPTEHDVYAVYCPGSLYFQHEKEKIQIASFHPDIGWKSCTLITHWQPLPKAPKEKPND